MDFLNFLDLFFEFYEFSGSYFFLDFVNFLDSEFSNCSRLYFFLVFKCSGF